MWTMPDKILRIVAGLLAVCAVGGFALGFAGAPTRGRLPGEAAGDGAPMAAVEARAFNTDELAPPKAAEPDPEAEAEKEKAEAEKIGASEKAPTPKVAPLDIAPPPPMTVEPAPPEPPPPEDPPF